MSDTVNATVPLGGAAPVARSGEAPAADGRFRGERVRHVRDPTAELQDAAEELTFAESEVVEKRLSQRRLRSSDGASSARLERIREYLRDVPDVERNARLAEFASSVLEGGTAADAALLRERARQFSADGTHQHLALTFARDEAVEEGADPHLVAALDEAIAELDAEQGAAVRAGLNVSAVASDFAGRAGSDVQELRDFYRDIVLDCADIGAAYERVVADHPGRDFDDAVRFLLRGLGADLAATAQSVSKPHIKQLMDDMYQLKALNSVHEQCEDLVRRVRRNFDADLDSAAPRELLGELLSAQDRAWQAADAFAGLPGKMGVHGDQAGIYLLQGFKELVRFVPLKAFGDDAAKRDRVMISVQQALDIAIDNEDFDD
ncbi:MAG: YopN family type III secretion system gatekeeper subunit [Gammaproteobacteria bacterium]|nr:YopN family type III secretion system gatekeeper subunit [Gammaproteobacteria bacterium]MYF30155.1 YopN family type III secretion system gatekeeper subunit [Gammaproteobacteria bacterium]MYK44678.1 YopN family type III secretion system gatekeeper subunit [Gammaproteobacteria bacterium]